MNSMRKLNVGERNRLTPVYKKLYKAINQYNNGADVIHIAEVISPGYGVSYIIVIMVNSKPIVLRCNRNESDGITEPFVLHVIGW